MHSEGLPPGTLGTVRNAAVLLGLLSKGPAYHQLTELADQAGLTLPTVHRLLRSLVTFGLVEQDPRSSRYGLGPQVVQLSAAYLARLPMVNALGPYLYELRNVTKATVQIALLVGSDVVYVDRVDGEDGNGLFRDRGHPRAALTTAAGRVLASRRPESAWPNLTDGSIDESDWRAWREAAYLISREAGPHGSFEVAVPVCDDQGMPQAALSASGFGLEDDHVERRIAPHLLRVARIVGGTGSNG